MSDLTLERIQEWLVEKVAHRIGVAPTEIDVNQYFDTFGLDSTEALVLAGELEKWLGREIESTALWYYPTIAELAQYLKEEQEKDVV